MDTLRGNELVITKECLCYCILLCPPHRASSYIFPLRKPRTMTTRTTDKKEEEEEMTQKVVCS